MNFLNKKYTSQQSQSSYANLTQSVAKPFLPGSSNVREPPSLNVNHCEVHSNELIRHICLDCVEFLCAECIAQHLEIHQEKGEIPKLRSIRQMRIEMGQKLDMISHLMIENNPLKIDVEAIRKSSLDKVEEMRRELMRAVDDWVNIMRSHLIQSIGFEQMNRVKLQMERLYDEIGQLKVALGNGGLGVLKKVWQIDGQKLQKGYADMFRKFGEVKSKSQFQLVVNWKQIIKSLESNISLRGGETILVEEEEISRGSRKQSTSRQSARLRVQHDDD